MVRGSHKTSATGADREPVVVALVVILLTLLANCNRVGAQTVHDASLEVERLLPRDTFYPYATCMCFIGPDDILVGGQAGKVFRIKDGEKLTTPVVSLPAFYTGEAGLLSIVVDPRFGQAGHNFVYISYIVSFQEGGYRIARFEWDGSALINRINLIYFPINARRHYGGFITFGPPNVPAAEQKIFAVTGDMDHEGRTENFESGEAPVGRSMVWRINPDGSAPSGMDKGPFYDMAAGNTYLEYMYAYGIRNSFGLAFDPVSGALWDTENGPFYYDEINRIDPGMNSGWSDVMGPSYRSDSAMVPEPGEFAVFGDPPVGEYSDPEFSWWRPVVPAALVFFNSTALGPQYENDCFVAAGPGIFHFDLNTSRTEFVLTGDLADKVYDTDSSPWGVDDVSQIQFTEGMGLLVDVDVGPDGYLYALSYSHGTIYRIIPKGADVNNWQLY